MIMIKNNSIAIISSIIASGILIMIGLNENKPLYIHISIALFFIHMMLIQKKEHQKELIQYIIKHRKTLEELEAAYDKLINIYNKQ